MTRDPAQDRRAFLSGNVQDLTEARARLVAIVTSIEQRIAEHDDPRFRERLQTARQRIQRVDGDILRLRELLDEVD